MKAIGSKKRCSRCRKLLHLESFNRNKSAIDGYQHRCRACQKKTHRQWYARHKDRRHAYYRAHRELFLAWHKEYHRKHRAQRNTYGRNYYRTHRPERRAYMARRRLHNLATLRVRLRALRQKVIAHYSRGKMRCACCHEAHLEFLAIDHINGNGGRHRKMVGAGSTFYAWLVRKKFPQGYRVLCHNCNASRGYYGYCPHETQKLDLGVVTRSTR